MNSVQLGKELFNNLMQLQYRSNGYSLPVISKGREELVKTTIQAVINDNYSSRIGELEAKLFAYEQIISKSNFKPFIEKEKENE